MPQLIARPGRNAVRQAKKAKEIRHVKGAIIWHEKQRRAHREKIQDRWEVKDQLRQVERWTRERSIEHGMLTPVFGTACPPKGLSGVVRRFAYARYSEARAAHWLLLLAADRIDAVESHVGSLFSLHPDNPVTQTGVLSEARPTVVCTHRPVLPTVIEAVRRVSRPGAALELPREDPYLAAGEALLLHVTPEGVVVAIERHLPNIG